MKKTALMLTLLICSVSISYSQTNREKKAKAKVETLMANYSESDQLEEKQVKELTDVLLKRQLEIIDTYNEHNGNQEVIKTETKKIFKKYHTQIVAAIGQENTKMFYQSQRKAKKI